MRTQSASPLPLAVSQQKIVLGSESSVQESKLSVSLNDTRCGYFPPKVKVVLLLLLNSSKLCYDSSLKLSACVVKCCVFRCHDGNSMWESLTNEEIYLNVASGLGCCMVCHIVRSGGVKGQRVIFAVFCCMQFF